MSLNYMALAVPLFLLLIGIEYLASRRAGRQLFSFTSSVTNMNVGVAERLADMFTTASFYFFYEYLHTHYRLFDIRPGVMMWIALLLATDFVWYWYHRLGHEINLFWGFHVVHHTSEEFNYTAGTRITVFQAVVRTACWSVLPVIGFPAPMITTMLLVHGLYPFFTHTQMIGRLGLLEYIMVTPSHHRVHHASNDAYLDKNFGDMFIIWDKLFGTFAKEEETPRYGLTKPLESHSFLWQHFHYLVELAYAVRQTPGITGKLKIIFGRPADFDPAFRTMAEQRFLSKNKVRTRSQKFRVYVVAQFAVMVTVLFFLLLLEHYLSTYVQVTVSLIIFITLINCGAILEQRRWVFYLEFARGLLIVLTTYHYFPHPTTSVVLGGLTLTCLAWFTSLQKQYLLRLYGRYDY